MPRASGVVVVLLAIGSFLFFTHTTSSVTYGPAQDRAQVHFVAIQVYDGVEVGSQHTALPVPVSLTVADMRAIYTNDGWDVHVFVHGADIVVTFPIERAVCVWVPAIVNGPKGPSIVSC